jgi:hypothetical protein
LYYLTQENHPFPLPFHFVKYFFDFSDVRGKALQAPVNQRAPTIAIAQFGVKNYFCHP